MLKIYPEGFVSASIGAAFNNFILKFSGKLGEVSRISRNPYGKAPVLFGESLRPEKIFLSNNIELNMMDTQFHKSPQEPAEIFQIVL